MTAGEIGARPAPAVLAALAALCAFLLASALSFWPYTVDDAFISLRYGQNLVHTGALVWNPGEAVEGFSNPLWTLYGALLVAAGVPPTLGLKLGGLACALACVPLTFMVARRVGLAPLLEPGDDLPRVLLGPAVVVRVVQEPREAEALLVRLAGAVAVGGGAHDHLHGAGVGHEGLGIGPRAEQLVRLVAGQGHGEERNGRRGSWRRGPQSPTTISSEARTSGARGRPS